MSKLTEITITFTRDFNRREETIQASILPDYGWQQWGATASELGENVDVLSAITEAAMPFMDEEEEEDAA